MTTRGWRVLGVVLLLSLAASQAKAKAKVPPENCPVIGPVPSYAQLIQLLFKDRDTITVSLDKTLAITSFLCMGQYLEWRHDTQPRTANIRATGPFINHEFYTTHARVRMYYSPEIVRWLDGGRRGAIADGAMLVKEMFPGDDGVPEPDKLTGYAVMIRDSQGSRDGWLWYIFFIPSPPAIPQPPAPFAQYGMSFCLSCHTSTDDDQLTFASANNLLGKDIVTYTRFNNAGPLAAPAPLRKSPSSLTALGPHANFALLPPLTAKLRAAPATASALPNSLVYDHVVSSGAGPEEFLTSDACSGCHDADYLLNEKAPMMMPADAAKQYYNLSEYGEWSASMMGLAGRDPVFLAQLESERQLHPDVADAISDFCFSCHAVMGQRQLHIDKPGAGVYFTRDLLDATTGLASGRAAKYGALGRDGVSCTACHHILPDKLGKPDSFNARFTVGAAGEVYGPFKDPKTYAMKRGLGIEPKPGAQLQRSALCGSCHTVLTPKIPRVLREHGVDLAGLTQAHEQSTYLEWLDSDYSDEKPNALAARSCQSCHMPDQFGGSRLQFQIANVEDSDFPWIDHRAPYSDITLGERPYRRHTLVGINLFTMAMFEQQPQSMGFQTFDALIPIGTAMDPLDRLQLAQREALDLARRGTVTLSIDGIRRGADERGQPTLFVDVSVKNRAGHKFPSGVGFRRAFVQLSVLGADGKSLWSSGNSNSDGELVDEKNQPLVSETTRDYRQLQPSYSHTKYANATIRRQDQVQIYESREIDDQGRLTTSFVSLFKDVKDNRILPAGWSANGPYHDITVPRVLGGAPDPHPIAGGDSLLYMIPTSAIAGAVTVRAAVYYQSIPPYYLTDRFSALGHEPQADTLMLQQLVKGLRLDHSPIDHWRLELAAVKKDIPAPR